MVMDRKRNRCSAIVSAVIVSVFWFVPDVILAKSKSRSLASSDLAGLEKVKLPPVVDYSKFVAFVRYQDAGGCGGHTAVAILDILKEREYPYAPDAFFFFNSWVNNTKNINQLEGIKQYGSASELTYPSNYDIADMAPFSRPAIRPIRHRTSTFSRSSGTTTTHRPSRS